MSRNAAISLARIVGMLLIVLCHITKYYTFIPGHMALGELFGCGVQLFIFISGYLYGGKVINKFWPWYAKRITTVALPAILTALITIIALLIAGETISVPSIVAYLTDMEGLLFLNWALFGRFFSEIASLGPLWFTTVIMLCYLFVPLMQKVTLRIRNFKLFVILLLVIGCAVSLVLMDYFDISYFWLFCVGYCLGKVKILDKVNFKGFFAFTGMALMALIGRVLLQKFFDETVLYSCYVPVSRCVIGNWVAVFFAYLNHLKPTELSKFASTKFMKVLDRYSYYVYLVHGVLCMGVFNLFHYLHWSLATVPFLAGTVILACGLKCVSDCIGKSLEKRFL